MIRAPLRRLRFGLSTLLGLAPRGFFIPYRHAGSVEASDYPALRPLFQRGEPAFESVMRDVAALADGLAAVAAGKGPARFDQDWFPRLDAAVAYAQVRTVRPRRVVEIGSGHSTRFLARAVADGGLDTDILCIDPAPRARLEGLRVRHERKLLRDIDPGVFAKLEANDILFVDSSHVAMPGTDVDRLLLDVAPSLAAGVLIHVHDIFLPDAYPAAWEWRGYNEQLLVGALLQGQAYEIVFASRYLVTRRQDLIEGSALSRLPLLPGAFDTSLWLRKR